MRIRPFFILFVIAILALSPFAAARDVTLAWDANAEPELLGYYLCYGMSSGNYSVRVDVGNVTQHKVSDLPAGTYYFAVKAYGTEGLESAFSNEVSDTIAESDVQEPTISGVSNSGVTESGATISWTTNETADTQIEYGTSTSYGSSSTLNSALLMSHSQSLSGLTSGTTYHYRVKSRDAAGNLATSGDFTFTTATPTDTTPPTFYWVSSSSVTASGATISWTTNEPADAMVEYGTSTSYGSSSILNSALSTSHSQNLSGLTSNTMYHYRVKSRDAAGNLAVSEDHTFTTVSPIDIDPPDITNVKTSKISGIRATITWDTNEASDSDVEYGTTSSYGNSVADGVPRGSRSARRGDPNSTRPKNGALDLDTNLVTSHSLNLNNLTPGNTYHFRVKSRDAAGNLAVSGDYTFSSTAAGDIVTGLAAAYAFDEGSGTESVDRSESGNKAILHSTEWAEGKYGRALSFNGADSYVSAGTQGLPGTNQPHTVSFWVSTNEARESAGTMLSLANAELQASLRHGYKNSEAGTLDFENRWAVVGKRPAPQTWHHFGYIFDGTRNSLYIDGRRVSTSTIQPAAAPVTSFEIGRWIDGAAYFSGSIDEVRIYRRALTEEQLRLAMTTPVVDSSQMALEARNSQAEDRAAIRRTAAPQEAKPVIAMQLEQRAYRRGETVRTRELWISNPSADVRNVELKIWLELPGMPPISLGGLGMGDYLRLAPGFNQNYGVLPLMEISDNAPDGTCRFGVRLVDPVTGEIISESVKPFRIGGGKNDRNATEISIESRLQDSQLRILNKGALAVEIEVKMWLEAPDGGTIPAFSTDLMLPVGADIFVEAPAPADGYSLRARMLHSITGKLLAEE